METQIVRQGTFKFYISTRTFLNKIIKKNISKDETDERGCIILTDDGPGECYDKHVVACSLCQHCPELKVSPACC